MKKKPALWITLGIVLAVACAAAIYCCAYPIPARSADMTQVIQNYYSGRQDAPSQIAVRSSIALGGREYYLIELDGSFGRATLQTGLFGRRRLTHIGCGGNFADGIVEANGKHYLVIGMRDFAEEVETITATIAGETYELRAGGNSGYILSHTEVSPFVEDNHIDLSCIKLYNASGTDITANYSLHGGGI